MDIISPGNSPVNVVEWMTSFLGFSATIALAVLAWVGNRQIRRIDEIEREIEDRIKRSEFILYVNELQHEIRDGHKETNERLDHIYQVLLGRIIT